MVHRLRHNGVLPGAVALAAAPVFLVALATLLAAPASAQENTTNVTTVVPKIEIVNVTPQALPQVSVSARYTGNSTVTVTLTCLYIAGTSCPNVTLVIGWNGTIYYNSTLGFGDAGCGGNACVKQLVVSVASEAVWVYYRYGGVYENFTVRYFQALPGLLGYVSSVLPFALAASMMARMDRRMAGLGAIMGGVLVYVLGEAGIIPYSPAVNAIAIVVGVLLLWGTR